ncbi:MAG: hypothetical protein ACI4VF_01600 [Lachnospirales bacterium]
MKKVIVTVVCIIAVAIAGFLLIGALADDSETDSASKEELMEDLKEAKEITDLINNGNYPEAFVKLEERFKDVDYSDWNKSTEKCHSYRLYYDKQGMYDEEMTVLLDYIAAYGVPEEPSEDDTENEKNEKNMKKYEYDYDIKCVKEILDKVSEENKNKAINLLGSEIA